MNKVYTIFFKGLFTVLPISLTIYLVTRVLSGLDAVIGDPLAQQLGNYYPGLGILIVLFLIFLCGLLVSNILTASLFGWVEKKFQEFPIVKTIYNPIRDITNLFSKTSVQRSQRAVFVETPMGVRMLGLVTRERFDEIKGLQIPDATIAVFIPLSYGVGGFTVLVPRSSVRDAGIPTEKAIQLALTGWLRSDSKSTPPDNGPSPSP